MFNKESLTFIKDFPLLGVYILAVACEALPNSCGYEVELCFFVGKQRGMSMVCFDNAFVEDATLDDFAELEEVVNEYLAQPEHIALAEKAVI